MNILGPEKLQALAQRLYPIYVGLDRRDRDDVLNAKQALLDLLDELEESPRHRWSFRSFEHSMLDKLLSFLETAKTREQLDHAAGYVREIIAHTGRMIEAYFYVLPPVYMPTEKAA